MRSGPFVFGTETSRDLPWRPETGRSVAAQDDGSGSPSRRPASGLPFPGVSPTANIAIAAFCLASFSSLLSIETDQRWPNRWPDCPVALSPELVVEGHVDPRPAARATSPRSLGTSDRLLLAATLYHREARKCVTGKAYLAAVGPRFAPMG